MYGYESEEKRKQREEEKKAQVKKIMKFSLYGVLVLVSFFFVLGCYSVMSAEEVGVKVTLGKIDDGVHRGFSFKWPFISSFKRFPTTAQRIERQDAAYTKDIQTASIKYVVTYRIVDLTVLSKTLSAAGTLRNLSAIARKREWKSKSSFGKKSIRSISRTLSISLRMSIIPTPLKSLLRTR